MYLAEKQEHDLWKPRWIILAPKRNRDCGEVEAKTSPKTLWWDFWQNSKYQSRIKGITLVLKGDFRELKYKLYSFLEPRGTT